MAKKIVTRYTFDPANNKIIIAGIHQLERILAITNVTAAESIYMFNAPDMGAVSHELLKPENETILVLEYDCSAMSANDKLQVFVETDYTVIEPSESLLDPVGKLRVSQPQNLIDTDFEYGLQPSKWETMELVNNIPSFYSNSADYVIPQVLSVSTIKGNNTITVKSAEPHQISIGAPIDVRGLSRISLEGKFLVTSVPDDKTFVFKSNQPAPETENLVTSYTTIIPGQFYTGSDVKYTLQDGIQTDANPAGSKIGFKTDYAHGFVNNTSLYLTNTIAAQKYAIPEISAVQGDGFRALEPDDYLNTTLSPDLSKTETREMTGTYALKITAEGISNGKLIWPNCKLTAGDVLLYTASQGDSPIGGLERFQVYYVKAVSGDQVTLCETTGGNYGSNAAINLTITGATFNSGRHSFIWGIDIGNARKSAYSYYTQFYYRNAGNVTKHGYTLKDGRYGYWGPGEQRQTNNLFIGKNPSTSIYIIDINYVPYYSQQHYSPFTLGGTGTIANNYCPIEDYTRFSTLTANQTQNTFHQSSWVEIYAAGGYRYYNSASQYFYGSLFYFPLLKDPEGDTLYVADHSLSTGDKITITNGAITTQTGSTYYSAPVSISSLSAGTYDISVVSDNRFRVKDASGTTRLNSISSDFSANANITSPFKDTLFLAGNNIYEGQPITVTFNGTPPTTLTGVQDQNITSASLSRVYNIVKNTVEDIITNNIGDDIGLFYQSGSSDYYPYQPGNYTTQRGRQYIRLDRNNWYLSANKGAYYSNRFTNSGWANETPWDPFSSTPYASEGYLMIASPFTRLSEREYEIEIYQIPGRENNQTIYTFTSSYFRNYGTSSYSYTDYNNDRSQATTTLGNGWRYTFDLGWMPNTGGTTGYQGYLCGTMLITNDNWTNATTSWNANMSRDYSRSGLGRMSGSNVPASYFVRVVIPINSNAQSGKFGTTSGTVFSARQLVDSIAASITSQFTYPQLSGAVNDVFAKPVGANRLKLMDATGSEYNFTSSGSGSVFVKTQEMIGGVDGYYQVSESTEEDVVMSTSIEIPPREINLDDTNISNDIITSVNHKFAPGQSIQFNVTSGSISGLTSGETYYVIPLGPDQIQLALTYNDALAEQAVAGILATAGSTYVINSNTISGIAEGVGTVTIVANSAKIDGTGTIFKSYFKPGDTIRFRDNTVSPNKFIEATVASITDDLQLTLTGPLTDALTDTNYYTETKINVRPDGAYLHRPFDGGVEITAGTSPNSSIVRQTRKYFRYQSGKGIQVSLAINFKPSRVANRTTWNAATGDITVRTTAPHGIVAGNFVTIKGSGDEAYNGDFGVISADTYSFTYVPNITPTSEIAPGIITYNIESYANSAIRCGLFDYQNGMFFEYDGQDIYAVRRSSTQQLPGTCTVASGSNKIFGKDTSYVGQLVAGDYIVVRGSSYKITKVVSNEELHIQPSYKGLGASNVILTKTIDTRVPQSLWNIDRADGTGPSGYVLDPTKIQMAYIDYSWYGAGKIRFGFKDTYGHVRYMHEFIHNNIEEEAYMRSGNIPGRYEIINYSDPTYVPSLFHWGTSVIMDGRFDDDKAYLFTAQSKDLTFSNGDVQVVTTQGSSTLTSKWSNSEKTYRWYVRLPFNYAVAKDFSSGIGLYTADEQLNGQEVDYTDYGGGTFNVYIYVGKGYYAPTVYPSVSSGTQVGIGAPVSGAGRSVDLTQPVPLISIRLAPSVDNNLTGPLGAREIINRMQLQLKALGISLTHDCEVDVILNGSLDSLEFENVNNPSLSELIRHSAGDQVIGGSIIFSFRASGGTADSTGKRLPNTTEYDLSQITDLGNSILGGDGVFPNGPDLLTIAIVPVDTSNISSDAPLRVGSRVTWTESQA